MPRKVAHEESRITIFFMRKEAFRVNQTLPRRLRSRRGFFRQAILEADGIPAAGMIEQLKNGVQALRMPVDNLERRTQAADRRRRGRYADTCTRLRRPRHGICKRRSIDGTGAICSFCL